MSRIPCIHSVLKNSSSGWVISCTPCLTAVMICLRAAPKTKMFILSESMWAAGNRFNNVCEYLCKKTTLKNLSLTPHDIRDHTESHANPSHHLVGASTRSLRCWPSNFSESWNVRLVNENIQTTKQRKSFFLARFEFIIPE